MSSAYAVALLRPGQISIPFSAVSYGRSILEEEKKTLNSCHGLKRTRMLEGGKQFRQPFPFFIAWENLPVDQVTYLQDYF